MQNKYDLQPGDKVQYEDIVREIVERITGGYIWRYPLSDKTFDSRNSNDPYFAHWQLIKTNNNGKS